MKKILCFFLVLVTVMGIIVGCLMWKYADNTTLQLTTYQISHEKIPAEFSGFRIAQISDLHNAVFGEENSNLLALLTESQPDIIVFTGDQLDARKTDKDVLVNLLRQALQIAPCYLVTGNHEGSIAGMTLFHEELERLGVVVLNDEITELSHQGAVIDLIGLIDATMNKLYYSHGNKVALETSLKELNQERDQSRFSILLAHDPEFLYVYERNGIDLALCGHVHGGQIRINGRGLIGPNKKLYPQYDTGVYTLDDATMVVSRGMGNSMFPWRINNPPELVIVELKSMGL